MGAFAFTRTAVFGFYLYFKLKSTGLLTDNSPFNPHPVTISLLDPAIPTSFQMTFSIDLYTSTHSLSKPETRERGPGSSNAAVALSLRISLEL